MEPNENSYYTSPVRPEPCECQSADGCSKVAHQYADISSSVQLKPSAAIGKIEIECCGEPTVCCSDNRNANMCEITILQKVRINIPISYNAIACVGENDVNCDCNKCCE
jgi:hypothetical protein